MLAKRIIPCLDVDRGRVVKGTKFVDIRDAGDPVEVAMHYNREGADELVMLDITASHEERDIMLDVVERIAECAFIPLSVGGGVRSVEDVHTLLQSGADKVCMNSAAIKDPSLIERSAGRFGSQCIVVAIDIKRMAPGKWHVFVHGGRKDTGIELFEWLPVVTARGAGEILLTSMDRDGTKSGFDLDVLAKVSSYVDIPVIASGGVGNLQHLVEGVLEGKADAVLAASIFHFKEYSIQEAKQYMQESGITVRL